MRKKYLPFLMIAILLVTFGTAWAWSNFSDGVLSFGVPTMGSGNQIPISLGGTYYFVDSGTGSDGNTCTDPENPCATINAAIDKAGTDDVIVVFEGHNEGITAANEIDLDVAGITLVGLGSGMNIPCIDFDNAAASVGVGANNVTIENIWFRPSANAIVEGIDINAGIDYTTIRNCKFMLAETATDEYSSTINIFNGSDYTTIENCYFDAGAQAAATAIWMKGTVGTIIQDNTIIGDYSVAVIYNPFNESERILVRRNAIWGGDPTGSLNETAVLSAVTGTSGLVYDNDMYTNVAAYTSAIICDGCFLARNWYNEDVGTAATAVEPTSYTGGAVQSVTPSGDD